jgi:anti-sigma factor (TIGR02949 family)
MADEIKTCRELDEHLTPYVDGEETPGVRRSVESHLAACPPCLEHAESETAARELVRGHRDELRVEAPPALRARCAALSASTETTAGSVFAKATEISAFAKATTRSASAIATAGPASARRSVMSPVRRWLPLSVAATLVLAVAGVFVFGLNDRVEALAASLAIDHVKCFKVGGGTPAHADPAVAARDWVQDQGWPVVVPKSEPAQQLTLVDVRRCFSSDGRAAHMMYTWRGAPLSLYVLPESIEHDRAVDRMGHEAVIWCANNRTYAVVAGGHPRDLATVVDYMKANAR